MKVYWMCMKMNVKLHKIDTPASSEDDIVLGPGKHVIGRGNLKDHDRRVSREHIEFEILSCGSVFVKALHANPIFLRLAETNGSDTAMALTKGERRAIEDGDQISLLPGCFSYKIEYLTDNNGITNIKDPSCNQILPSDNSSDRSSERANDEDNNLIPNGELPDIAKAPDNADDSDLIIVEQSLGSPCVVEDDEDSPSERTGESSGLIKADESAATVKREADTNEGEPSAKRQRSDSEANDKNELKENIKSEPTDAGAVKAEEAVKEEEAGGSGNGDPSPAAPVRPGCMYGAACYRKNPIHRADFSHPSDADWTAPPDCPWGAACYRQSQHHRAKYNHVGPPAQRPPGVAKKKRPKKNTAAASPVPGTNPPLGKRNRPTKAKKRRPSWSGSGSDNEYDLDDPFMTDNSSDDYQPSTSSYSSEDSDL